MALTASPLFGMSESRSQSRNLVEFRAGKMFMSHGNMVHPDTRKGMVYVYQSADGLMHFCWKDRTTGAVEDDLIIFPDDAEYKHVPQCKTGRVYVLKFKSSSRRQFFWLQEPKTEKDEEFCNKVNEYLNHPPSARAARRMRHNAEAPSGLASALSAAGLTRAELGGAGGGSGAAGSGPGGAGGAEDNLQSLLLNLNQDQLMELFGGVGGLSQLLGANRPRTAAALQQAAQRVGTGRAAATGGGGAATGGGAGAGAGGAAAVAATPTSRDTNNNPPGGAEAPKAPIQLAQLQSILRGIKTPEESAPKVDLSAALNSESLKAILENPEFMEALSKHVPEIKDKEPTDEVKDSVKSPQFQQAVTLFSSALQSGQLGPLIQQFGLGSAAVAAANSGDLEGFLKALDEGPKDKDKSKDKPSDGGKRDSAGGDDDDENMAVD